MDAYPSPQALHCLLGYWSFKNIYMRLCVCTFICGMCMGARVCMYALCMRVHVCDVGTHSYIGDACVEAGEQPWVSLSGMSFTSFKTASFTGRNSSLRLAEPSSEPQGLPRHVLSGMHLGTQSCMRMLVLQPGSSRLLTKGAQQLASSSCNCQGSDLLIKANHTYPTVMSPRKGHHSPKLGLDKFLCSGLALDQIKCPAVRLRR